MPSGIKECPFKASKGCHLRQTAHLRLLGVGNFISPMKGQIGAVFDGHPSAHHHPLCIEKGAAILTNNGLDEP